jgi:hypothetical protein
VYDTNPIFVSGVDSQKILVGKDYYLYFEAVIDDAKEDFFVANFFIDEKALKSTLYTCTVFLLLFM